MEKFKFTAYIRLGKKDKEVKTYQIMAHDIAEAREWAERQGAEFGVLPKNVDVIKAKELVDVNHAASAESAG